jgi:threonine aldolase
MAGVAVVRPENNSEVAQDFRAAMRALAGGVVMVTTWVDGRPWDAQRSVYDAISVSLVKGPGAPVGGVVAFAGECRERAREIRRMLGGAWASPGPLAEAGLQALETGLPEIGGHCEVAASLARLLADVLGPDRVVQHTNMVIFDVGRSAEFFDRCVERGLLLFRHTPARMRAVVHRDIGKRDLAHAVAVIAEVDSAMSAAEEMGMAG